jgi:hypothetical protein
MQIAGGTPEYFQSYAFVERGNIYRQPLSAMIWRYRVKAFTVWGPVGSQDSMLRLKFLLHDIRRELESGEGRRPTELECTGWNFPRCMTKVLVKTIFE